MVENSREKILYARATFVWLGALLLALVCYLFFLNLSVVEVVTRNDFSDEHQQLRAEIASLESEYIKTQHTIAARVATLDGFDTDAEKVFVNRTIRTDLVMLDN